MYIKKMLVKSFGKYQDKEINLEDGINLIYGPNEAGKSTIHKFIEGMFYGFYKPYVKNKKFTLDYDRFLPWHNSNQYKGILIYNHDGKEYRIERDFMKRNDKVEIFDNSTGENITEEFDYDSAIKLYQPASKHIGINKSTFVNTISIEQLSSKTSEDLVKEVKDSLINLGESRDEEISVRNVVDKLDKKLDEIGTATRKKTTPYGMLVEDIKQIKKEKQEAEKVWEQVKDEQETLNTIRQKLEELEKRKEDNEEVLHYLDKEEIKKKYDDAVELTAYIDLKTSELEAIKNYKDVDIAAIDAVIKKMNTLGLNREQHDELKSELLHIDAYLDEQMLKYKQVSMLEGIESDIDGIIAEYSNYIDLNERYNRVQEETAELKSKLVVGSNSNNLVKDVHDYNTLEEKRKDIRYSRSNELEIKEQKHQTLGDKLKQQKTILILSLMVFGGLLGTGIIINDIAVSAASVLFVLISLFNGYNIKKNQNMKNALMAEIKEIRTKEEAKNNELATITQKQKEILKNYQCQDVVELRELKDQQLHTQVLYEDNKRRYEKHINDNASLEVAIKDKEKNLKYFTKLVLDTEELTKENIHLVKERYELFKDTKRNIDHKKNEREEKSVKIKHLTESIKSLNEEIKEAGKKYSANTETEFLQVKDKRYAYHTLYQDIENKKQMLVKILGESTLEELKEKLIKYDAENMEVTRSKEELLLEQDHLIKEILQTNKEITAYETKIANLQKDVRALVDIEEDISINEVKRVEYDNKIKALTIAKEAIETISKDIQNNFAPKLNEKVSELIGNITNNKYTDIKVNPNMEILTYEPDNDTLIAIDQLSKGTMDQMYFGLRLGIIDIIKEDISLPLILDDCFVQYDKNRLEKVMKTLGSLGRQIIILSCHQREERILSESGIEYNYIQL